MKLLARSLLPVPDTWRDEIMMLPLLLTLGGSLLLSGCDDSAAKHYRQGEMFPLAQLSQTRLINAPPIQWSGKTLVVNFWATWCLPCRKEMPSLQALSNTLDDNLYTVIGVSIDKDHNLLKEFLLEFDIDFTILQDSEGANLASQLDINAYPETFIVSPQGRILTRISGSHEWNTEFLNNAIENPRQQQKHSSIPVQQEGYHVPG